MARLKVFEYIGPLVYGGISGFVIAETKERALQLVYEKDSYIPVPLREKEIPLSQVIKDVKEGKPIPKYEIEIREIPLNVEEVYPHSWSE